MAERPGRGLAARTSCDCANPTTDGTAVLSAHILALPDRIRHVKLDLLLTVLRRRILWAPTISYVQHEQPALDFVAAAEPLLLNAVARVLGYADLAAVPAGVQAA